ncbi:glycerophosphodiester phosphodiesterase [Serinibacter salmoneus]|uniref:Glycerophosphoryl diester phosphodiesterase n=1 Tax=Serinibacter salmoneus TaxID=556530 RepID=A0A2A9CXK3_9MICO|nr:glycerophosphodiester phosphodiesterase family protein [Serinibacter salmoneus]PFG19168.1 glycerophosphoryl diester phosphodiesterase [Serinibacter salmoneus]
MSTAFPLVPGPGRPLVIAHRGAPAAHPENTAAAFGAAARAGADAIETDVQLSADGVPFLLHDDTPDRTTDALARGWEPGTLAERATWETLRALDASGGTGPVQRVPHLDEVAAAGLAVDLEIKTPIVHEARDVVAAVAEAWRCNAVWRPLLESARVAVTSFDPIVLTAALDLLAPWSVPIGLITEAAPQEEDLPELTEAGVSMLVLRHDTVTPELVAAAHTASLTVWTYTVNADADRERVLAAGVDGYCTDHP